MDGRGDSDTGPAWKKLQLVGVEVFLLDSWQQRCTENVSGGGVSKDDPEYVGNEELVRQEARATGGAVGPRGWV